MPADDDEEAIVEAVNPADAGLALLGLRDDADEGDVKRAYARLLRTTRPDEDAKGFQRLNAAYKAALAAVRRRARAATPSGEPEPVAAEPEPSQAEVGERHDLPEVDVPAPDATPPRPFDMPDVRLDDATASDDDVIDIDAFSRDLLAVTSDPDADLRGWLDARMATWPLSMKPALVPHVLHALDDAEVAVAPRHFETLIAAFGLDDVLSGIDAVAIARLRAANEARFANVESVARGRRLLTPGNRRALDRAVRVGGYPPFAAPALAWLVTGAGASRRTGLRWVPLLACRVMNLLRYVSADRIDMLSPPIEPRVLGRWQSAERQIGWLKVTHLLTVVLLAACLSFVVSDNYDQARRSRLVSLANARFTSIVDEQDQQPQKAIDDYAALVLANPPPRSIELDQIVVTAMYNESVLLAQIGRTPEAAAGYRALDETFGNEPMFSRTRLIATRGLNNWFDLLAQRKDYQAALAVARRAVARCSNFPDEDEDDGEDGFEVQLAKAMIEEADALKHLGDRSAVLAICRGVVIRFAGAHTANMKRLISIAHDMEREYGVQATVPPTAPGTRAPTNP